jgi:metal-responsive CopG/Arc/MetJ family transcriptional regulator
VATRKLSITLPTELADDVERLARERGLAVSTWLAEAAREALRHQAALAAIADYEAEFGRFTDAELAAAQDRLARMDAVAATKKRRRSRTDAA